MKAKRVCIPYNMVFNFDPNNEVSWHQEDRAVWENCVDCITDTHSFIKKNIYNKHYYLYDIHYSPVSFAKETNHKICLICKDFCKQECFI